MFEILVDSLPQALAEDKELQEWKNELYTDPLVRLASPVLHETDHIFRTLLRTSSSVMKFALSPICYPLSKVLKPTEFTLTPCPFPTSRDLQISGDGAIAIKSLNFLDRTRLHFKNLASSLASSRSPILRNGYRVAGAIISVPLYLLLEPSKESLVILAIQRYFPTFNVGEFADWLESSFLPFFIDSHLRGATSTLKLVANAAVVQERQLQIADVIISGCSYRSRLFSVSDVDVLEFDFKGHLPVLNVKCCADHSEEIRSQTGEIAQGGPEDIRRTEYMVEIGINTTGNHPEWKVNDVHIGTQTTRI
jgi:hypothetical protein